MPQIRRPLERMALTPRGDSPGQRLPVRRFFGAKPNVWQLRGRVFPRRTLRDGSRRLADGVLYLLPPRLYSPTFGVPGSPTPSQGRRPPVHVRSTRGWSRQLPRGSTCRELLPCAGSRVRRNLPYPAVLLRLPSIQAAEFKNNSALPKLFLHQIIQHQE